MHRFRAPLQALLAYLLIILPEVHAVQCGKWFSKECLCDTDERYCDDPALDNILDQDGLWADLVGYYSFESFNFGLGGVNPNPYYPQNFGYFNHTIKGSRDYQHRYLILPPVADITLCPSDPQTFENEDYVCGETGSGGNFEGFSTSTFERDGSLTSTSFLSDGLPDSSNIAEESDYKLIPVDKNTLYGSAASDVFFVTETFVFTKDDKSEANAIQDVYMKVNGESFMVQSTRTIFTRLPDAETFIQMIQADYDKYNITQSGRSEAPMTTACLAWPNCPTEELWCEIDPTCSNGNGKNESPYRETDGVVKPGVIAGFLVAGFVILFALAYLWHRRRMQTQSLRYRNQFARRVAETVSLTGTDRQVTAEALVAEFDRIDNQHKDGLISKEELWEFVSSGKAGEMDKRDFDALFSAIDLDKNGSVDFLEFCAFMGHCDDEFEAMKKRDSVMAARPSMKATAATRLSMRQMAAKRLSTTGAPLPSVPQEVKMEQVAEEADA